MKKYVLTLVVTLALGVFAPVMEADASTQLKVNKPGSTQPLPGKGITPLSKMHQKVTYQPAYSGTVRITHQTVGIRKDGTYTMFPENQYVKNFVLSDSNKEVQTWASLNRYCTIKEYTSCALMVRASISNNGFTASPYVEHIGYYRPFKKI